MASKQYYQPSKKYKIPNVTRDVYFHSIKSISFTVSVLPVSLVG